MVDVRDCKVVGMVDVGIGVVGIAGLPPLRSVLRADSIYCRLVVCGCMEVTRITNNAV